MGRVTIGRTPEKDAPAEHRDEYVPISRFLPILEAYAEIWDVAIVADWPEFQPDPRPYSDGRTVTVHFFHEQMLSEPQKEIMYTHRNSNVLGFSLNNTVGFLTKPLHRYGYAYREFVDFEGKLLCHKQGNSIYVDFDFLRSRCNDHEAVLEILLAWGLSNTATKMSIKGRTDQAKRLAEYVRARCAEGAHETHKKFTARQQKLAQDAFTQYENDLMTAAQLSAHYEAAYLEALHAYEQFEAFDREMSASISTIDLGKDFDRLRNLEGVKSVRVKGDSVIIATHPLVQMYPPPSVTKNHWPPDSFDVGSIELTVDTAAQTSAGVTCTPLIWGTYRNRYFTSTHICFGGGTNGLNTAIAKMLVAYKIPDLVALVLTFFRFVYTAPVPVSKETKEYWRWDGQGNDSFDGSEETWEREKQAYVALGVERLAARGKKERWAKLTCLRDDQNLKFDILKKCWDAALDLKRMKEHLASSLSAMPSHVESIFCELAQNVTFLGCDMIGGLRIWFYQPHVFLYPSVLWLESNGALRLLSFYRSYNQVNHLLFLNDNYCSFEKREELFRYIAEGKYAQFLNEVLKITHQWTMSESRA